MANKRTPKSKPLTTAQRLASLIKSARQTMRKDKGLSTDLDRLPLLTWLMFLKFLDDMEELEESRAKMAGRKYRPTIDPPYRWRDWAADEAGITGPELLAFITQEEAAGPDGEKRAGLLPYLRGLSDGNGHVPRRRVVAAVFKDVANRMISGYLLREVINQVNRIHFLAEEELFTLGHLYETMLREMRDAAGENGEFYTPRPVVRFMVAMVNPQLGETILDPAAGTGGFLAETFTHLQSQVNTVQDRRTLQQRSLFGGEAKPLPYLLCQMNLLLHGLEHPQITPENSLSVKLTEIGERERVDVILTNPPFGGEEERGILANFPDDKQTAETALLFLQLIMRRLHRRTRPGRAAVIVPNGTLFGDGVCARIKEQLLKDFDLHTVVRLPQGVFSPYTDIPTNILFFAAPGPTTAVWFYEVPLPDDRKKYSKTKPLLYEDLASCVDWFQSTPRSSGPCAWRVPTEDMIVRDENGALLEVNLDSKNPHSGARDDHRSPLEIAGNLLQTERRVLALIEDIEATIKDGARRDA